MAGATADRDDDDPFAPGVDLEARKVIGLDATGRDLRDMRVLDSTIIGTSLRGVDLSGGDFDHVRFEFCDLAGVTLGGTRFEAVEFVDCILTGIDWTQARWSNLSLPAPLSFSRSRLDLSSFLDLSLTEVRIDHGSAVETDFSGADLRRATIRNVDLRGAIFNGTDLRDSHLEGSVDYLIDPATNPVDRCTVSFPGASSFLVALGLDVIDPPEPDHPCV